MASLRISWEGRHFISPLLWMKIGPERFTSWLKVTQMVRAELGPTSRWSGKRVPVPPAKAPPFKDPQVQMGMIGANEPCSCVTNSTKGVYLELREHWRESTT